MKDTSLKNIIMADLARIDTPKTSNAWKWYFFPKGTTFPYIVWFRILQSCKRSAIKKYTIGLFAYHKYNRMTYKYGIHLNSNINVGKGLYIVHGNGVYLNCKEIGDNFTVYQCVTLGSENKDCSAGPVVGNNVTIYTGAVVAGEIILHDGAVIGANSFVDKDVPENTLAITGRMTKLG